MSDSSLIDSVTLDALIEASQDHLMITDAEGNLVAASDSVCSVYGLSSDELLDTNVQELAARGILTPSVTLKVLGSHSPEQVLQTTATGRSVIADGYPVFLDGQLVRVISRSRDINDLEEEYGRLQRQLEVQLRKETAPPSSFEGIEASSPEMLNLVNLLSRVSGTNATIVLLGESGVGKTSLAKAIHKHSKAADGPFIELNCASLPESIFESEMFGYVAGAFSGAVQKGKPGLIEQADGGTLFLDEIGELSMSRQSKLLKVLQDNTVMRLGDTQPRQINFRLIVATHQDLAMRVREGLFRLDLYYRLNVIPAWVPPLRERREEIPALVNRQRMRLKQCYGTTLALNAEDWGFLMSHDWPGNVRELENYLERLSLTGAAYSSSTSPTSPSTLPEIKKGIDTHEQSTSKTLDIPIEEDDLNLTTHLEAMEKELIQRAYQRAGNTRAMATLLGISQPSVVRKMARYGLQKSR